MDIAGRSIYCDETGGDYYDFIPLKKDGKKRLDVIVGDVSGHGISSALIMAAVRASLRQRLYLPGSISQVLTDVNHQLVADIGDSGQFITLFYLSLDPMIRVLNWVRPGHEPAIFYDPATDQFEELAGDGVALGVDQHARYAENEKRNFSTGSIIVLGTDGIWESRNSSGEMLGKGIVKEMIRKNASRSAADILEAVITNVRRFQEGLESEDDLTLVVVKATAGE